tara:strand:+ start:234 stop:542 length:309 start_codon:yes stop_codon:yes gene_type:complete
MIEMAGIYPMKPQTVTKNYHVTKAHLELLSKDEDPDAVYIAEQLMRLMQEKNWTARVALSCTAEATEWDDRVLSYLEGVPVDLGNSESDNSPTTSEKPTSDS